jgi:hypothetical protein
MNVELNRKCPNCNTIITYKSVSQLNNAIKYNRNCKSCSNRVRITIRTKNNKNYSKVCNECKQITTFSNYTKYKNSKCESIYLCKSCSLSKAHKGKILSIAHINSIKKALYENWVNGKYENVKNLAKYRWEGDNNPMYNSNRFGKKNPFYGKTHTKETIDKIKKSLKITLQNEDIRNKMSISAKKRVIENGIPAPNYNKKSIPIIEEYGAKNGYNFQHAENGGEYYIKELGYFVDGYDKEKNVVIEYYEPYHKRRIEKDVERKNKIVKLLNCKFIEIKEWEI